MIPTKRAWGGVVCVREGEGCEGAGLALRFERPVALSRTHAQSRTKGALRPVSATTNRGMAALELKSS